MAVEPTPQERRALLRVVRGTPSDEELAALTVVLAAAASAGGAPPAAAARSAWNDPAARMPAPRHAGRNAWKTSFWPR